MKVRMQGSYIKDILIFYNAAYASSYVGFILFALQD